jgi:hypothetical protein
MIAHPDRPRFLRELDQTEHTVSVVLFQNEFIYLFIFFHCREKKNLKMRNSWAESVR